jgi:hypothetical protein
MPPQKDFGSMEAFTLQVTRVACKDKAIAAISRLSQPIPYTIQRTLYPLETNPHRFVSKGYGVTTFIGIGFGRTMLYREQTD